MPEVKILPIPTPVRRGGALRTSTATERKSGYQVHLHNFTVYGVIDF